MKSVIWRALILLLPLLLAGTRPAALAENYDPGPPAPLQDNRPKVCTITYLMEDISTDDTYAARMRIAPTSEAAASNNRLPCPTFVPERINERALDFCRERAGDPKDCVFADMGRGFQEDPARGETSAGASRCASDLSSQIGIACWSTGKFDVCNVSCGQTAAEAQLGARNRCEAKHERQCNILGSLPVLAP
jgi:hypothetical protein